MEQIRQLIRKQLQEAFEKENSIQAGEYTTEEMEKFLFQLIDLINWGDKNYGDGPHITIPNSWPSSSVCYTKPVILEKWEEAKRLYNTSDTHWYVWKATVGESIVKPKYAGIQRLTLDSILNATTHYPETFRFLSIGVTNEEVKQLEKNAMK